MTPERRAEYHRTIDMLRRCAERQSNVPAPGDCEVEIGQWEGFRWVESDYIRRDINSWRAFLNALDADYHRRALEHFQAVEARAKAARDKERRFIFTRYRRLTLPH